MATEDLNVDSEYVGFSPLSLDDIRNFFDSYIIPYAPYKGERVFKALMNTLTEYYYGQAYTVIPNELKQIFENANFEIPFVYDQLLIAIGVPQVIIDNISLVDKLIFLKTLSDFERYKGTVLFFQKVAEAFSDKVSIYELFIDRDLSGEWVFKPVKIYLNTEMELHIDSIPYDIVYDAVPSFLVSKENLTELYNNNQLILPIKSNLLLLDNNLISEVSMLYDVIVAIFLHEYKENYIDVYFTDDVKTIQLKTIYCIWYYLITKYYDTSWPALAAQSLLRFIFDSALFPSFIGDIPTTISDLSRIIDRYNDITITSTSTRDYDNCQRLRDEFYNDIAEAFYTFSGSNTVTTTDIYNELTIFDPSLITYLDERISHSSIGEKAEINLILTEIYSSLILHSSTQANDVYFSQYIDYFLKYLPQIIVDPKNTTTYTILYNLKPYHVDLYSLANVGIKCQDKFNQVYIDDESGMSFLFQLTYASLLNFSDDNLFNFIYNAESNVNILSGFKSNFIMSPSDDASDITDANTIDTKYTKTSILQASSDHVLDLTKDAESNVNILSGFKSNFIMSSSDDASDITDANTIDTKYTKTSILQASIDYLSNLSKDAESNVIYVESYTITKTP